MEKSQCTVNMKKIGKIIKERRKSLKVNQLELSELAGVGISWWPSSVEKAILNWLLLSIGVD